MMVRDVIADVFLDGDRYLDGYRYADAIMKAILSAPEPVRQELAALLILPRLESEWPQ